MLYAIKEERERGKRRMVSREKRSTPGASQPSEGDNKREQGDVQGPGERGREGERNAKKDAERRKVKHRRSFS